MQHTVIVSSELENSDLVLKALKADIDEATLRSAWSLHKNDEAAAYWIHVMGSINGATLRKIIYEEDGMEGIEYVFRDLIKQGFFGNVKEDWMREGVLQGERRGEKRGEQRATRQIITFLKSGHSLEEAEKKFAYA